MGGNVHGVNINIKHCRNSYLSAAILLTTSCSTVTEIEKKMKKKMKNSEKKPRIVPRYRSAKEMIFFLNQNRLSFIKYMFMFAADELISDVSITREETGTIFRTRLLYP